MEIVKNIYYKGKTLKRESKPSDKLYHAASNISDTKAYNNDWQSNSCKCQDDDHKNTNIPGKDINLAGRSKGNENESSDASNILRLVPGRLSIRQKKKERLIHQKHRTNSPHSYDADTSNNMDSFVNECNIDMAPSNVLRQSNKIRKAKTANDYFRKNSLIGSKEMKSKVTTDSSSSGSVNSNKLRKPKEQPKCLTSDDNSSLNAISDASNTSHNRSSDVM